MAREGGKKKGYYRSCQLVRLLILYISFLILCVGGKLCYVVMFHPYNNNNNNNNNNMAIIEFVGVAVWETEMSVLVF